MTGRVGERDTAEDILQSAYVKAVEKISDLRDPLKAVPWFLRIIHSAIGQYFRREKTQRFTPGAEAPRWLTAVTEPGPEAQDGDEPRCLCAVDLLGSIKPEYAAMVRAVDLEGRSPSTVADELGISANNSRVRLYRARAALRRELSRSCGGDCARRGHSCRCRSAPG